VQPTCQRVQFIAAKRIEPYKESAQEDAENQSRESGGADAMLFAAGFVHWPFYVALDNGDGRRQAAPGGKLTGGVMGEF